mgnify:CR=1 FL=1
MRKCIVFMLLIVLTACSKADRQLTIGIIKPSVNHLPLSYGLHSGEIDGSHIRLVSFTSGWEASEALVAGKLDAAILPFTYVWSSAAKGYPIRTVSFLERETDAILVSPGLAQPLALSGKKVGLLKASSLDVLWQDYAKKEGIGAEKVYFRSPNEIVAALQNGDISAAVLYEPIVSKLAEKYPVLARFSQRYNAHPCCNLAVNTRMLDRGKISQLRDCLSSLSTVAGTINIQNPSLCSYALREYGMSFNQLKLALGNTIYRLDLEQSGKNFERKMAQLSLQSGYLTHLPADDSIYWDIHAR